MNIYQIIQDSLVKLFKGLYPDFDVVCEEIPIPANGPPIEDYIFLDLIPVSNETAGPYHTDRRVLVDVAIHTKAESNAAYRAMGAEIDAAVRPVFRFGERAITIPDVSLKIVDQVLHCTFTIAFRDSVEAAAPYPIMGELDIAAHVERT